MVVGVRDRGHPLAGEGRSRLGDQFSALARLERDGQITAEVVNGPGPRDTKRLSITASGRNRLASWVVSPLVLTNRSEFMLRVRCLWLTSPDKAHDFLLDPRAALLGQPGAYAHEEADFARLGEDVTEFTSTYFGQFAALR